jgi:hypothetical protein
MSKTLAEEVFYILPQNMADYNDSHQRKLDELLKLDNDDIPIAEVKFAPRHRPEMQLS